VKLASIVIAIDFSEPSRHALQWAGALALRFDSRLTVVSIVDPLLADAARIRLGQDLTAETEPALRDFVAATWAGGACASLQPRFQTAIGESAAGILQAAAAVGADLIVLGTQGLGGLRKWLIGSTTERLLRQTQKPVLAVPPLPDRTAPASEPGVISHILAAVDFSDGSAAAAKLAARVAAAFAARLTMAHVVEPLSVAAQWRPILAESNEQRLAAARAKLAAMIPEVCSDRACDQVVVLGRPAELIGSIAAERAAQLIAMGLAGAHGAFAQRPGSIAYRVLSSAMIPVLVAPALRR
jgi:nucleotide-binding universal stress UspA family protein